MIARRLLAALAVLAAGCGEETKTPEPGLENPPGYFGLQVCSCYLYETDGSEEILGVALERTVELAGRTTYELKYRNGTGQLFRTELVEPTSPDLLLWDVQYAGGVPSWRLAAGLPLVRWPPEGRDGEPVTAAGAGAYRESSAQVDPVAFEMNLRSDYGAAGDVTFQRGEAPETKPGVRVSYQLTSSVTEAPPWSLGAHTFVPDVGFVKLEQLDTGSGSRIWELYAIKPLPGCPFTGQTPGDQICGLTVY